MSAFQELPLRAKVYVLATTTVCAVIAVTYLSFMTITLRRAFEATSPWETVGIFLIVTLAVAILARVMGLHESR